MEPHLRDLQYFVGVAEELNFTRAAERLHVSQPALSKQIRALEATLRARLFERDPRGVQLTSAGEALLESARRILAEWEQASSAVTEAAALQSHVLRVGTLTSIGRDLYPGIVDHFAERQPDWRIELRSFGWGDPSAGLRDRSSDAGFLWLPVDEDELEQEVLVSERRFVALSSQHRLSRHKAVEFKDLVDEAFVALPPSAGILRDFWLGGDHQEGGDVTVGAEVTTADETFEIVSSGTAVHLLAEGNATLYARPGITCIPVTDLGPAQLAVAWRRSDRRVAVRAFVQSCIAAVGDLEQGSAVGTQE